MILVLMGPSGAGKSTVGRALAEALGWPFHDADDFHLPASVARMRAGLPLDDADRAPWLAALAALVMRHARTGESAVLACSALRREYRAILAPPAVAAHVRFVYLRASPALLARRVAGRAGHFFPPALLASQLAALEEPDAYEPAEVLTLDADRPVAALVQDARAALGV